MKPRDGDCWGAWRLSTRDGYGRRLLHRDETTMPVNCDCIGMCPVELVPLAVGHFMRRGGSRQDAADLRKALDAICGKRGTLEGHGRTVRSVAVEEWDGAEEDAA